MKVAAFTMVRNESIFLPIWMSYYGRQLGRNNCFVIDHGSDDHSTCGIGWNCLRLPSSTLDEVNRAELVRRYQSFLLCSYDAVIFSDADEIIVADPTRFASLTDLVARTPAEVIAGVGLALTHAQDLESPIDYRKPILSQRRFIRFQDIYCKPLIGRKPINWHAGFHRCDGPFTIHKGLYIFHLKAIDFDQSLSDLKKKRHVDLSERSKFLGHNIQFTFSDEEMISTYFPLRGDKFSYRSKKDFQFDEHLGAVAAGNLSGLRSSFKETYELPDEMRLVF